MSGWELHEVFSSLCLVMVVGDAYILIVQMLRFTSFIACWDRMIILKVMAGALANIPRSWACGVLGCLCAWEVRDLSFWARYISHVHEYSMT